MKSNAICATHAIGMFDSGVGGLTVLKQVLKLLPEESVVYYGDTARIPYGEKSPETVVRYSLENTLFLLKNEIKIIVIACNTASAYALDKIRQTVSIPVIGVIEPGVDKLVEVSSNQRVAILGTRGTIRSGVYQKEICKRLPNAYIKPIACPLFVPLVEERYLNHDVTRMIIKEYLHSLNGENIDTILLGCTHYPLLKELIQEEVGEGVTIVDSASTCAERVSAVLHQHHLRADSNKESFCKYFVSDDVEKFRLLGTDFLGRSIPHVELFNHFEN